MVLAGAPGLPQLTPIMGQVAIEQGRAAEEGSVISDLERELGQVSATISNTTSDGDDDDDMQPPPDSPKEEEPVLDGGVEKLSRRTTVGPSQTTPTFPAHRVAKPRLSYDPFGQEDPQPTNSPSYSTPSLLSTRKHRSNAPSQVEALLQRYDQQSQTQLLRSHFCRSEVRSTTVRQFPEPNVSVPGSVFTRAGEHHKPIVDYPRSRLGKRVESRTHSA